MLGALASLALFAGCTRPTHDRATLSAIKAESRALMQAHPNGTPGPLPKGQWPGAIASLQPAFVTVDQKGVDIMVKPDFDGGYRYYVPKQREQLPGPVERYSSWMRASTGIDPTDRE